jgi:hypothetical protein
MTSDYKYTVCETQMQVNVYLNDGGGITIEQLDSMQNDSHYITLNPQDIPAFIRILNRLKKEAKQLSSK